LGESLGGGADAVKKNLRGRKKMLAARQKKKKKKKNDVGKRDNWGPSSEARRRI